MKKNIKIWVQDFKKIIKEWWFYVDKTKPIYDLIREWSNN